MKRIFSIIIGLLWVAITTGEARAENLAYDQYSKTIPHALTEHSRKMAKRIMQPADNVYLALGYGLSNVTMIEGSDGLIIIDALDSYEAAAEVMREFRKITDKPVKALIYTHYHYDHLAGAKAFLSQDDVDSGRAHVYAHDTLMNGVENFTSVVSRITNVRANYSFGSLLEQGPQGAVNAGIGPVLSGGTATFIRPTVTFSKKHQVTVAGVRMELHHAPSESNDEIVVWFPDMKLLHTAEVIQGETFPNLHTIRGTKYRDPVNWYRAFDQLLAFNPEISVPSHGRPVAGQQAVAELYRSYRDAIQYVHDQTIRYINKGYTPDELVSVVHQLPPHLRQHPWLGEFYGTVKHSVRQIYKGYLGWFEGDPTFLDPLPRATRSRAYVKQMGGRDAIVTAAQQAFDAADYRWTAELLTHVIRVDEQDKQARRLKAKALRQLGYQTANINWRNWYLSSALELEGTLDWSRAPKRNLKDLANALPTSNLLQSLSTRLRAEAALDTKLVLAIDVDGSDQKYSLEIRRGVMQLHDKLMAEADMTLNMDESTLRMILLGGSSFMKSLANGKTVLQGDQDLLKYFLSLFDMPEHTAPASLTVR